MFINDIEEILIYVSFILNSQIFINYKKLFFYNKILKSKKLFYNFIIY